MENDDQNKMIQSDRSSSQRHSWYTLFLFVQGAVYVVSRDSSELGEL